MGITCDRDHSTGRGRNGDGCIAFHNGRHGHRTARKLPSVREVGTIIAADNEITAYIVIYHIAGHIGKTYQLQRTDISSDNICVTALLQTRRSTAQAP